VSIAKLKKLDEWTSQDVLDMSSEPLQVSASQVVEVLKGILSEENLDGEEGGEKEDTPPNWNNAKSIGIILSKLRFRTSREATAKRSRFRDVTPKEIAQLAVAHHLVHLSDNLSKTSIDVHSSEGPGDERQTPFSSSEPLALTETGVAYRATNMKDENGVLPLKEPINEQGRCSCCGANDVEMAKSGQISCQNPNCCAVFNPSTGRWYPGKRQVFVSEPRGEIHTVLPFAPAKA
jgi:hypothetical protein